MDDTDLLFARHLSRHQLIMLDLVAGLGFVFVSFTATAGATALPPWVRIALPLALGFPLIVRRLWPMPVFCFTLAIAILAAMADAFGFAYLAPAYALYLVALSGRFGAMAPTSAIGAVSVFTIVGLTVAGTPREGVPDWLLHLDRPLLGIAALGGAWTIGRAVHERRLYAARDAERLAAQAVTEERLRIARELHDVVTHSVGLIAVKAGVANHVMATRPEEAHDALRVIETASRSALVEMRHLLGVLRSTNVPDLVPAPGLGGIEGLAQQARLAGVDVKLEVVVAPGPERGSGTSGAGERGQEHGPGLREEPDGSSGGNGGLGRGRGGAVGVRRGDSGDAGLGRGGAVGVRRGDGTDADLGRIGAVGEWRGDGSDAGPGSGGEGRHEYEGKRRDERSGGGGDLRRGRGDEVEGSRGDGGDGGLGRLEQRGWNVGGYGGSEGSRQERGAAVWDRGGDAPEVGRDGESGVEGREETSVKRDKMRARLPDGVELSIYRIVQEALTNVVKHAAPARCRVSVVADGREVRIEVVDDGPGRRTLPAVGTGHGLVGMRERVMMYGGVFEAGRLPGKGFRVLARLPYEEAA
ncbi:hypothetical protein GCM10022419_103800 [Nonomuraea rosea]|uniref:histidine kinase n=1 Tax=Nonomuraea rosea TaxID=638574 RepID=A0ABP6ZA51_9ACTN